MSDEAPLTTPADNSPGLRVLAPPADDNRVPPGPPANPVDVVAARRNPLRFLTRVAAHGDLVRFFLGTRELFLVANPDNVKQVLVKAGKRFENLRTMGKVLGNGLLTSEGEFHRRQRRLIQPAFHHSRIAGYGEVMVAYADRAQSRWRDGQVVDIRNEMTELTLSIVGKTLFDTELESEEAAEFRTALTTLLQGREQGTNPLAQMTGDAIPGDRARLAEVVRVIDEFLYALIERKRHSARVGDDILSMLLVAHDDEGDHTGMTDQQVRDEALALVAAGHETVANALTWTWWLLSQYPEAEARLHAELDEVLGDRLPTVEDLPRLTYTEMVMTESMRLYPPVPMGGRRAIEEQDIGGYRVPEGATVLFSQRVVHHDERWYPDPERFDPNRWTPVARAGRPKFAYFPFGGGARLCIGEPFAWMEGKLVIATIASGWRMLTVKDHLVSPQQGITLRPGAGIRMELRARRERRPA